MGGKKLFMGGRLHVPGGLIQSKDYPAHTEGNT